MVGPVVVSEPCVVEAVIITEQWSGEQLTRAGEDCRRRRRRRRRRRMKRVGRVTESPSEWSFSCLI